MNFRDRIEREHADSTDGYRGDPDDRPSRQELREDQMEIDKWQRNRPRVYFKGWELSQSATEEDTR
jgi:hypothetical protein